MPERTWDFVHRSRQTPASSYNCMLESVDHDQARLNGLFIFHSSKTFRTVIEKSFTFFSDFCSLFFSLCVWVSGT